MNCERENKNKRSSKTLNTNVCLLCGGNVIEKCYYYSFPKDRSRTKIWLQKCGLSESTDVTKSRLCHKHFTKADFTRPQDDLTSQNKRRRLKVDAVPSIFDIRNGEKTENEARATQKFNLFRTCCICDHSTRNSRTNSKRANEKISYFRFPKDPFRRKVWLQKCGLPESIDVQKSRLCYKHFTESDFTHPKNNFIAQTQRRHLKAVAVPSIFDIQNEYPSLECQENSNDNVDEDYLLGECRIVSSNLVLNHPKPSASAFVEGNISSISICSELQPKEDNEVDEDSSLDAYRVTSNSSFANNTVLSTPIETDRNESTEAIRRSQKMWIEGSKKMVEDKYSTPLTPPLFFSNTPAYSSSISGSVDMYEETNDENVTFWSNTTMSGTQKKFSSICRKTNKISNSKDPVPLINKSVSTPERSIDHIYSRKLRIPRHPNEVATSHMCSPYTAKKSMIILKKGLSNQRREINRLRHLLQRRDKKIRNLKEMIDSLKNKYLSEDVADCLMVRDPKT